MKSPSWFLADGIWVEAKVSLVTSLDHEKWECLWGRESIAFLAEKKWSVTGVMCCVAGKKNREKVLAGDFPGSPQANPSKMSRKRQNPFPMWGWVSASDGIFIASGSPYFPFCLLSEGMVKVQCELPCFLYCNFLTHFSWCLLFVLFCRTNFVPTIQDGGKSGVTVFFWKMVK